MRSKEDAQDYRYFPDPDLLPLVVTEKMIDDVRRTMPELPEAKRRKFEAAGLTAYQASTVTGSAALASYSETALAKAKAPAAEVTNWIIGTLLARLNDENLDVSRAKVPPEQLGQLVDRVADGTLSGKMAKEVFDAMWSGAGSADSVIEKRGLKQISDSGEIEKLVDAAIAAGAKQVEDYRSG